jgi:hypothetical protein
MAISHRATGTPVFSANSFTPGIPAGAAAGDMMLLLVAGKPYNAGYSVTAGWTQLGVYTDGTVAAGVDVGSMQVTAFWKEHDGSESNPTVTEGSPTFNSFGGLIMVWQKGAGDIWETPVDVGGGDNSAGTGFSVTGGSDPGIVANDVVTSFGAFRSDAATPCTTHLVQTATGVTFTDTHDPATDPETTGGGDMAMCVNRATVTGTSSAAPVIAATLAAAHTGSAMLIRLRVSTDRRYQMSFAEFEVPNAPRRYRLSFAEFEVPTAPRRYQMSFTELEIPNADRRYRMSFAEFEIPTAPRRYQMSFAEFEIPTSPRRYQMSFAELEVPDAPAGGGPEGQFQRAGYPGVQHPY